MSAIAEEEPYVFPPTTIPVSNAAYCACCLSQETRLVDLDSCRHLMLFTLIPNFEINVRVRHVCTICHSMLAKFTQFCHQVAESVQWLNGQASNINTNKKPPSLQLSETLVSSALCSEPNCSTKAIQYVKEETDSVKEEDSFDIKQENIESDSEYDVPLLRIKEENLDFKVKVRVKRETSKNTKNFKSNKNSKNIKNNKSNLKKKKKQSKEEKVKIEVKKEKLHKRPNFKDKIRRVTLTEEEFQQERERDRTNSAYIGMNFKCDTCIVGFNYEDALQVHMKARHLIKPDTYTCSICKTILSNERRLTAHRHSHYKRFECRECGHVSRRLISAKSHYNKNHEVLDVRDTFPCIKCDFVADSYQIYQTHLEKHNECKTCHKLFPTQSKLKQHQLAVHEKVKKYECRICQKQFGFQNALNSHELNVHGTQKAAYCVECDKYYKSELTLRAHYLTHKNHISIDDKKYVCEHCNERFLTKRLLEDHIPFKHFPTTLPKCDICNKRLATQRYLERHIDFVHNKKRLPKSKICNYCGKGFTSTEKLNIHMRVHTGERPLACPMCPAMFAHPSALYTHKKLIHKTKGNNTDTNASAQPTAPTFDPSYFYG